MSTFLFAMIDNNSLQKLMS